MQQPPRPPDHHLQQNPHWKGGRCLSDKGYVRLKRPGHPLADGQGYVYEHRLVMQELLGRPLARGEIVKHRDRNRQNNAPDNLYLVSRTALAAGLRG